ncbi:N-acetylglucosamine-6-phosphate deacetylase [Mitsuokella sp.]|uniref:N-acetylglucosamine-6-phosphate deacetylase n=1 Tax=Mitsuokella TaxID=52225 RepID=UPI0029E5ED21|nr:N-acetylglucosamine-6-phosphate deacetylase [Mitsuokella sp.]MDD6382278.1 N-acetylglucosamine-6-phosphate deacetylase [Selenomonadaceae bacterium]MDY4475555.1 N-acetylglucosamine-6-phosphate deacetylase [Mitsuokella sp.]
MKAIIDGRLVMPDTVLDGYALLYDGNTILDVVTQDSVNTDACESVVRADGALIMPGFINEHIHGCAGVDTMDEDAGALLKMQQVLPATGVTSFLPTTMTYDRRRIEEALQRIRQAKANPGTRILGAHMEGPFISQAYKGAQKAENISAADFSWLEPYADVVKIITLAPETLKDRSFLEQCAAHHIIVSVGHSAASYEEVRSIMADCPFYHITHLFNAMTPLHHRKPGIVGAALLDPHAHCELICDNLHVHPAAQELVYRMKGQDGIILITDSLRACLLADGESELGGQKVFVHHGEARLADGTLAGSIAPMNEVVHHFLENSKAPLHEVIAMATANPARDLGVFEQLGSLEPGKLADIVLVSPDDFQVKKTLIDGQVVYTA